MRISYLASSYFPFLNGVSFAVHRRARWLLGRGHQVQLLRPQADDRFPEDVRQREMPGWEELSAFDGFQDAPYPAMPHPMCRTYPVPRSHRHWNVDHSLDRFRPDLILIEDIPSLVGLVSPFGGGYRRLIGADYARRARIPTVTLLETAWVKYGATYFGSLAMRLVRPIVVSIVQRVTGAYDLNLAPSTDFLERSRAVGVRHCQKLPFHGVDNTEFSPANRRFDPIPNDPRPTLLFVGRLVPEKSVLELLDAFDLVRQEVPAAHLVIIGSGPQERQIRKRATRFGASVSFPGETYGDALKGWYARADLFINPSASEAFCTTNLEAMASGTPLVAAASGGHLDQIIPDHNGLLSRPHDPVDLARQISDLLSDRARLARLSAQCRESMRPLDWNVCCERLEATLLKLVAGAASDRIKDSTRHPAPIDVRGHRPAGPHSSGRSDMRQPRTIETNGRQPSDSRMGSP
ncbi:MAG: glycosyltransferase [Planctomycetales bacterium]